MSLPSLRSRISASDLPRPSSAGRMSARSAEIEPSPAQDVHLNTPSNTKVRVSEGIYVSKEDVSDTCGHGFFSRELALERKQYLTIVIRALVLVILLMWISLPAFWGALSDSAKLTPNYDAWFVNRDSARIGNTLAQSFFNSTTPGQQLGWINVDPQIAGSDQDIINAVVENGPWIVVVVEANATMNLVLARENGDKTYNPESAITVYYAQARSSTGVGTFVLPITTQLLTSSVLAYATGSAQRYFAQITPGTTVNQTAVELMAQAPQTLSPAIWWTMVNLRPYTSPTAQAIVLVGNIFIIIFAFVSTMAHCTARAIIAPRLAFSSYLVLRLSVPLLVYMPLAMSYALVSLAFDLPFGGKFSYGGGFMLTFVFVYLGMTALGLALEAVITILTPKFVPFFLFILIIFNVSPVLLPLESMNSFFSYGLGFPIYNLSEAITTILFNTHSDLGRNAGVIVAWIALSCGTVLVFTWIFRARELQTFALMVPQPPSPRLVDAHAQMATLSHGQDEKKSKGKGVAV